LHAVKEGINVQSQALKVGSLAGNWVLGIVLIAGLPPETLRIAAQTLAYLERNAQPIIRPGDEFLTSFLTEETRQPMMDEIAQIHAEDDAIEELQEVVDIECDNEWEQIEDKAVPRLYSRILSDKEKRKMEKVHAQAEKDAERERKRTETATLKVEKGKEKFDKKMGAETAKSSPMEMSVEG